MKCAAGCTGTLSAGRAAVALLAAVSFGCAPRERGVETIAHSDPLEPAVIERLLRAAPVGPEQDFRADTLAANAWMSMHLLQFRTHEGRHIHQHHDLTFIVYAGEGEVYVNDRRNAVEAGDVFHIPRNVPHYCVNRGDDPLVAVLIFTPPYDLKDSLPLSLGTRSYERREP